MTEKWERQERGKRHKKHRKDGKAEMNEIGRLKSYHQEARRADGKGETTATNKIQLRTRQGRLKYWNAWKPEWIDWKITLTSVSKRPKAQENGSGHILDEWSSAKDSELQEEFL